MGKVGHHHIRFRCPALGRHTAIACVNSNGDLARKRLCRFAHKVGVFNGHGTKDHARQPFGQPAFDRGHIADTAAQLRRHRAGGQDRLNRRAVHRLTGKSAIQINKVEPFAPGRDKLPGLRGRIVVEHGRLVHFATQQADGVPVFQVDCGVKDHGQAPNWDARAVLHDVARFAIGLV